MTTQLTISESIRNSLNKEYGKKFKKLTRASKLLIQVNELKNDTRLNEVSESLAKLDESMANLITFFLHESVKYPLVNKTILRQKTESDIQARNEFVETMRNRYSVGSLILFSDMPLETVDSFSRVNVRFYVTSHDYESETFAGNADIFSKSGELISKRVMVLKYKVNNYYTRNYNIKPVKPLLKPETKTIPPLAFIIESYVPNKNGSMPKRIKPMNYWKNLFDCELALYEREHRTKQTRLSFTNFVSESRVESPKTRTIAKKFKHVTQRTESSFEIVSYQNKKYDMTLRIDSDTRKQATELPKTVRSLFSFVSFIDSNSMFVHSKSDIDSAKKACQLWAKSKVFSTIASVESFYIGESELVIKHNPPTMVKLAKLQ